MSAILTAIMALIAQLAPLADDGTFAATITASTSRDYYAPLLEVRIDNVPMYASVADDEEERSLGLSGTTMLPEDVTKVFVFPTDGQWSFWMKDMNYPIDIIWTDASGKIVHIETSVDPSTYPNSFSPDASARYVLETVAGFTARNSVEVGDKVDLTGISGFSG